MRFPIRFTAAYRALSKAVLISPADSYVDVTAEEVQVRMAWAFRATFPRSAVGGTKPLERQPLSRGVHGWAGRWLVNGSGDGILVVHLVPAQRAYVMGFPVKLRELLVSIDDTKMLAAALAADARG
jgi:hypothetical protein